jgi:SAM-dependent methyltransferase/methyltransferase-like protein
MFPLPASRDLVASYEAVAYESRAIRLAEPDAMAAMATLHGLAPAFPDRCRVLELGCASGGNVISMAFRFPKSTFLGIDLVPGQIEAGRFAVSELALRNVELQARSIVDINDADGTFDYIICHGVYSWVPAEVQDAILRVCNRNLAPNGVAYVSYNTFPGWHRRGMLRDILMFHDDPSLEADERVARARALTRALGVLDPSNQTAHFVMLREEANQVDRQSDRQLFHEQLEPWNSPVYFAEFVERAAAHGLAYVTEATPIVDTPATSQFREAIGSIDRIRLEQYLDFVRGRTFRKTLLCHADAKPLSAPTVSAIPKLALRSRVIRAEPAPEDAARGPNVVSFKTKEGATITTNNPVMGAAFDALVSAAPAVIPFPDLKRRIDEQVAPTYGDEANILETNDEAFASALMLCANGGLLEFRVLPSIGVVTPGIRPKASSLARWQALYFEEVSTLGHWSHKLSGAERFLLAHLDGTKDRAQLVRVIEHAFASGDLALDGFSPTRENLSGILEDVLSHLGQSALLVS